MKRIGLLIAAVCIICISAGFLYWSRQKAGVTVPPCQGCNVIVIDIDPLRADSLYRFGHMGSITPSLKILADEGFLFTNAFAVSSWTLPSAMSLMTGTYPSVHKIVNKELVGQTAAQGLVPADLRTVSPNLTTLAAVFKENGYATGGFAGGAALDPSFGFDKGFDSYESPGEFEGLPTVAPKALQFIQTHTKEPLFVYIHGFDTHGQYIPPGGLTKKFVSPTYKGTLTGSTEEQKELREQGVILGTINLTPADVMFLRSVYEEKVAAADKEIGSFLASYRAMHISRKTIFVFTSDHGEEFYEHGRIDHGMTLYDEVIHVPLIIVVPGVSGGKVATGQVRNIDIMPTLFALAGITPSASVRSQMQGTSIVPTMNGVNQHLNLFAETVYRYATSLASIRMWDGWKFIFDRQTSAGYLFNLRADPGELHNVSEDNSNPKAQELMTKLMQYISNVQIHQ